MKKAYGSAALIVGALVLPGTPPAGAAEAKVLTAGAFRQVLLAWCPITSGNGEPCGGRQWHPARPNSASTRSAKSCG
jgi:hypothetical protein